MRVFFLSFFIAFGLLFISPDTSFAQAIVPCDGIDCGVCHFVDLGNRVLNWIITVMSSVCALVIVVAGLKMVMAGGNSGEISQAKAMITNTLIGFVILLAAWLIVDTVLKVFVSGSSNGTGAAEIPGFGPWNKIECVAPVAVPPSGGPPGVATTTPGECKIPPLSPITDPQAQQMEAMNGKAVIWPTNNPMLQTCVNRFISQVGGGQVSSAYRPPAYQTHLFEIRDRWCTLGLRTDTNPACGSLKNTVQAEASTHFGGNWQCGAVGQTSTHSSGNGVDITGVTHSNPVTQRIARDNCLVWRNYQNDPYHYDFISGCSCK